MRDKKAYFRQYYSENRKQILDRVKIRYEKKKPQILEYLRSRRGRDYELRKSRRHDSRWGDEIRTKEALYRRKIWSKIKQREAKRHHDRYFYYLLEEAPQTEKHYAIWSDSEIQYLIEHFQSKTTLEMAKNLGRTWAAVGRKLYQLRLVKLKPRIPKT